VDDGKSTLIGRLLLDSGAVYDDQLRAVEEASRQRGVPGLDLSLLTDGLEAEREQQITIDVAYRYFSTARRRFVIADVPGHEEYTRNMVTGVSTADVAVLLVDVRHGLVAQSRRHLHVCSLLRIAHVVVVVNKMDTVDYRRDPYLKVDAAVARLRDRLAIRDLGVMPVSAVAGDMVVKRRANLSWYDGPTLLDYLENVTVCGDSLATGLRLPVQYVIRPHQDFRGFAGYVESGVVRAGDRVVVLPSRAASSVRDILVAGEARPEARAGQSIVVTLADELDAGRGHTIVDPEDMPTVDSHLEATLCWFSQEPVQPGRQYLLKHTTQTVRAYVDQVQYRIDPETQAHEPAERLERNAIGSVLLTTSAALVFDPYARNRATGSFILVDEISGATAGAGLIVRSGDGQAAVPDQPRRVTRGAVVWFTGLPASGKTTVATRVAERLSGSGLEVEHLDGDEFRKTFSRGLGFTPADRAENIERAARVAALLARHRVLVLATFVSPARAHRDIVKGSAPDVFEVFVNAPLEVCMERDPKGMYREARAGTRPHFTGVGAPYEAPLHPDLELRTDRMTVDEAADAVVTLLGARGILI